MYLPHPKPFSPDLSMWVLFKAGNFSENKRKIPEAKIKDGKKPEIFPKGRKFFLCPKFTAKMVKNHFKIAKIFFPRRLFGTLDSYFRVYMLSRPPKLLPRGLFYWGTAENMPFQFPPYHNMESENPTAVCLTTGKISGNFSVFFKILFFRKNYNSSCAVDCEEATSSSEHSSIAPNFSNLLGGVKNTVSKIHRTLFD